MAPDHFPIGSR